ncbi:hypothetical protein EXS65_03470 [Candidatus Peribacteria bacterium]|nr:hypothetical protein [Candidatus Peribacteria bacterium]
MKTSLNHQLHRTRVEELSKELSEVRPASSMERQKVAVIGRNVRNERLRFKDACLQKLSETGDLLHQLNDFTVHPKPGVSQNDEDLFSTLGETEQITTSVNQRWESVTKYTGPSIRPSADIQTIRLPEYNPLKA